MEFLNGICKKEVTEWDELTGTSLLNQEVVLEGAVHSIRNMGDVAFVILRRREGLFQTVVENEKANLSIHDLKEAMTLRVKGILHEEERAPHGREVRVQEIEILSSPAEPMPLAIDKWKLNTSLEAKLNLRPIALRNIQERSKFKIQEALVRAFRDFLYEQGFTEIHTPKIGARGAEGGANLFKFSYFHKPAVLAQSPQFYKQMMVGVFDRVFETGPVFRAEKHNTKRHLNEYTSLDFEMGYIDGFEDIMGLEPEEEALIGRYFKEEYNADFVFVTHYPSKKRPFYAMDDPQDDKFTLSFDLLFHGLEVTTGGQRIHDYNQLKAKIAARGMEEEGMEQYLDTFKHGMPPHGGLGIGLERLTMQLLGEENVREACLFPRDLNRLEP